MKVHYLLKFSADNFTLNMSEIYISLFLNGTKECFSYFQEPISY